MGILGSIASAGSSMLGNLLGSAAQSAMGYYMAKKMAKYNYDLQKQGYKEFPSAQVQGLESAGINPMVAYGGIAGATAHAQNYQPAPNSTLGSDAVSSAMKYKERNQQDRIIDLQAKQLESTIKVNDAVAAKNDAEATAIGIQAAAQDRTSRANEWQLWDNKTLREAGLQAYIEVNGKYHQVHTIRINKVTGEAYTADGRRIDKLVYKDIPQSAMQATNPIYQMIKIDGSGVNSFKNSPSMTISPEVYDRLKNWKYNEDDEWKKLNHLNDKVKFY